MLDRLAAFIVGEGNWLPVAMLVAAVSVSAAWKHGRLASMNLFVGVMLLVMGVGHLLAVSTKLMQGTLNGRPALLFPIGVVIVVPALLLIRHYRTGQAGTYNAVMATVLVALGLINIPLAIPALLNIAYSRASKPRTRQLIVGAWVFVVTGLFIGGMMFMLSGAHTFEEFERM